MSRKHRIDSTGAFHHIMIRDIEICNNSAMTMQSGEMGISVAAVSRAVILRQKIAEVKGLYIN